MGPGSLFAVLAGPAGDMSLQLADIYGDVAVVTAAVKHFDAGRAPAEPGVGSRGGVSPVSGSPYHAGTAVRRAPAIRVWWRAA